MAQMETAAGAATDVLEYTTIGTGTGVVYGVTPAGGLVIVLSPEAPERTRYGNPAWHLGGAGKSAPSYVLPDGRVVAIYGGTVSQKPTAEQAKARAFARDVARLQEKYGVALDVQEDDLAEAMRGAGA